jgi:tRNA modification GTPase
MKAGHLGDTIVALSTGQGIAAISVIRLSGPKAIAIADDVFKGKILADAATHTLHYGRIINEAGEHLDDVVVGLFKGPKSFTGEDVVEISCHGSPYIVRELINLLIRRGARPAEAGEFTMRAFVNGRLDLSQAEAVADLIASHSKAAHDLAIRQLRGGVSTEIQALRQKLLDFASLVELELDFSEEDVEFADRTQLRALVTEVIALASRLRDTFRLGNAIREGIPTVIAGRPNAGKSTILNRLLQEERAIVSDIPGTTRDTIEELLVIDGLPFRLIDTAGIREAHDEIETIGIGRTMEKIGQASILIYVFDIRATSPEDVKADVTSIAASTDAKVILAANKMDLDPYAHAGTWQVGDYPVIPLSALHQMNIPYLLETLAAMVRESIPQDIPMITSARHYHALDRAIERLQQVLAGIEEQLPGDLVAQDIRQAIYHLSEITGEISSEDILGNIFGKFCIGK